MTPQERTDQLAKELALTAEQKAKVLDVFTKQDEARQKVYENRGDRETMRASMEKMREETSKQLKSILSADQFAKYEKLRSEMTRGGMGPGQPQRMTPAERTDRLAKELSLTGEQKAKVLALFTKQDEARQKAFSDRSGDREAMRASMQKEREEFAKNMKAILTEEQFAKYEKLDAPPGGPGRRPE
jgi:Spy/CpxP family protein refolding chaperone